MAIAYIIIVYHLPLLVMYVVNVEHIISDKISEIPNLDKPTKF